MNLDAYRNSPLELERTQDLLRLIPTSGAEALDVGARDGHFSRILATRFASVVALDLEQPQLDIPGVRCVAGNATAFEFANDSFDFVFCAEVIEHIPSASLEAASRELARVTRKHLLIGVPFRQDLRVAQTRCVHCHRINPPWGHVNAFDVARLESLFAPMAIEKLSFVGSTVEVTNAFSATLLDLAGNPFGTWIQHEPCVHCGKPIGAPPRRNLGQKVLTRVACVVENIQRSFTSPKPNWVHVLFRKTC